MDGEIVNIVNRTTHKLSVTRNGVEKTLLPGDNHLPEGWVRFAKQQNPRMGTEDYGSLGAQYLVGVKVDERSGLEQVDDISPIAPGDEHISEERINRQTVPEEERRTKAKKEKVQVPFRGERSAPLGSVGGAHEGVAFRDEKRDSTGVVPV